MGKIEFYHKTRKHGDTMKTFPKKNTKNFLFKIAHIMGVNLINHDFSQIRISNQM